MTNLLTQAQAIYNASEAASKLPQPIPMTRERAAWEALERRLAAIEARLRALEIANGLGDE